MPSSKVKTIIPWLIFVIAMILILLIAAMWKTTKVTRVNTQEEYAIFQNDLFQHGEFISRTIITLHKIIHYDVKTAGLARAQKELDAYTRAIVGHQSINLKIYSKLRHRLPQDDPLFLVDQIERLRPKLIEQIDFLADLNGEIRKAESTQVLEAMIFRSTKKLQSFSMLMNENLNFHSQVESRFFKTLKDNNASTIDGITFNLNLLIFLMVSTVVLIWFYLVEQKKNRLALKKAHDDLEVKVYERTRELHGVNEELTQAQRIAGLGSWKYDVPDDRLEWSDELYRIFGVRHQSHRNLTFEGLRKIVHHEDRDVLDMLTEKLKNHGKAEFEYRWIRDDGEIRTVWWQGGATFDDDDNPLIMFGTVQDITDRKQVEQELEKSRVILDEAEVLAGLGGWEWDMARDVWTMSDNWARIHGVSENKLSTDELLPIAHPEDISKIEKAFSRAVERGDDYDLEHRIIRQDTGEIRIVKAYGVVKSTASGQTKKMFGTAQDITEQRLARKALKESEARYRSLVEFSSEHVFMLDKDGRYLASNNRVKQFQLDSGQSLIGQRLQDVYPLVTAKQFLTQLDRVVDTGGAVDFENQIHQADGLREYLNTLYPIVEDNEVLAVGGICRDVTDQKRLDLELRQTRKMESIGTLAGGVAHDFNNILYMITGNAELSMEEIPEWNPVHGYLEEIKTASIRAAGVVKQLLNFSRKTDQRLRPIGAVTVIKDALKFIRSTIPSTIDIHMDLPSSEVTILGDPVQIHQALMNICANASLAMKDTGGTLDIEVGKVQIRQNDPPRHPGLPVGDFIQIVVRDTGPGIDGQVLEHIFDPYFTTRDVGKGSGMGLAVVHGIVKNHHGSISVDSQPGKGAVFTIHFPVVDQRPGIEPEASAEEVPRGSETILFVDDEVSITKLAAKSLSRLGYHIEASTSPIEALECFKSKPAAFDLVLTDMTMPKMTGVKLSEKIKEIRPDIPIIICTGHSALVDEQGARTMGIDAYVMKPLKQIEIAKTIRKVLDEAKPSVPQK